MNSGSESLGRVSLRIGLVGLTLPGALATLVAIFVERGEQEPYFILDVVLFGLLELIALGCGFVARRTATGKTGMKIATLILLFHGLAGVLYFLLLYRPRPGNP